MFSRFIVITMLVVPMLFALAEPIPTLTPSPTSAPEGKRGLLDNIGNALTSIGAEIGDEITEHAGNIIDQITAAGAFQTLVSEVNGNALTILSVVNGPVLSVAADGIGMAVTVGGAVYTVASDAYVDFTSRLAEASPTATTGSTGGAMGTISIPLPLTLSVFGTLAGIFMGASLII